MLQNAGDLLAQASLAAFYGGLVLMTVRKAWRERQAAKSDRAHSR